jgi:hypothetical protein
MRVTLAREQLGGRQLDRATIEVLASSGAENPAEAGLWREADEGTRTLDLLHGKQTL